MEKLQKEVSICQKCDLYKTRTQTVFGAGNINTDIVFIGEAPGKDEDIQGKPFVGRAGKFLNELLASVGLSRDDIYITNILKCRPPNNRDPDETEIKVCSPYLEKQIDMINPKVIVTLGRYSLNYFLPGFSISKVHGQPKRRISDSRVIFPMYHPAVALYRGSFREILINDMKRLSRLLDKWDDIEKESKLDEEIETPENLKLF